MPELGGGKRGWGPSSSGCDVTRGPNSGRTRPAGKNLTNKIDNNHWCRVFVVSAVSEVRILGLHRGIFITHTWSESQINHSFDGVQGTSAQKKRRIISMSLSIVKLLAFLHLNHKCDSGPQKIQPFSDVREQTGSRIHHVPMNVLKILLLLLKTSFRRCVAPKWISNGIFETPERIPPAYDSPSGEGRISRQLKRIQGLKHTRTSAL